MAPVITIAEPEDGGDALRAAVRVPDDVALVILTSPNAARELVRALTDVGAVRPTVKVLAVGPGTAATAERLGLAVWRVAARHVAEGVLDELSDDTPPGGRVLIPQAAGARPLLRETLAGARMARRCTGRVPDRPGTADTGAGQGGGARRRGRAHERVDGRGPDRGRRARGHPPTVVTIGPETTRAARAAGLTVAAEAEPHTLPGLVDAVVRAVAPR